MKSIRDLELAGKRVLLRVDFDVPLSDDGDVLDDWRIRLALPTLRHVLDHGASAVLLTHLGAPHGVRDASARQLRVFRDAYVNDAFASSHLEHATLNALPRAFPKEARATGLLVEREIRAIDAVLGDAERPVVAVFGGARLHEKLGPLRAMIERADRVLVGGAIAATFLKARGVDIGDTPWAREHVPDARELFERGGQRLLLPDDFRIGRPTDPEREAHLVSGAVPAGWEAYDVGVGTLQRFENVLARAKTIVWSGPLGRYELPAFSEGTRRMIEAIAESPAESLAGGGATVEAIARAGRLEGFTHVSSGGAAFLQYLERGTLPALEVLDA